MTEEKTELIEKAVKLTEMFSHKRATNFIRLATCWLGTSQYRFIFIGFLDFIL